MKRTESQENYLETILLLSKKKTGCPFCRHCKRIRFFQAQYQYCRKKSERT